jgi:heme-degrading monooxygenase HmoA
MIGRLWSARTTAELCGDYVGYFSKQVLEELRAVPGFVSAEVLTRETGGHVEILVLTVWQSLAAITAFAGPDRETAVVHPAAKALLTEYDNRVRHFELALLVTR